MSANLPDFEKAEYLGQPATQQPQIISGNFENRAWDAQRDDHARFTQSMV